MKRIIFVVSVLAVLQLRVMRAQGTFVYDQQSVNENTSAESFAVIQVDGPVGQSFTPALSSVGFVRLELFDLNNNNGLGATVRVNLRTNSITGTILGTTASVFMPDGFGVVAGGVTNLIFPSPVSVTPGTTYYFDLMVQSGDFWAVRRLVPANYPGGTEFIFGQPGFSDLWFREGIIVPEPQAGLLVLTTGVTLHLCRRREGRRSSCASSV